MPGSNGNPKPESSGGDRKKSPSSKKSENPSARPSRKGSGQQSPNGGSPQPSKESNKVTLGKKMEEMIAQDDPENAAEKLEDSNDSVLVLTPVPVKETTFSMWEIDHYFHEKLRSAPSFFRYIMEWILLSVSIIIIPVCCASITGETIEYKKVYSRDSNKSNHWQHLFKIDVFFCTWYLCNVMSLCITEGFSHIVGVLLKVLQLYQSEPCWRFAQTLYAQRAYLHISISFFSAFVLSLLVFFPFHRPSFSLADTTNTILGIILWLGIHYAILFLVKFIVNFSIFDVKQSVYRDAIIDINSKSFIFCKLKAISEARKGSDEYYEIIEDTQPGYDTGLYLKYLDVFTSEDDARIIATNIFVLLEKKSLGYNDIKEYFPENPDAVYKYITESDSAEDTSRIVRVKQFAALAVELYRVRRDMAKSLRDRDAVYDKLDLVFSIMAMYVSLIVLLQLFNVDYKTYIASAGTTIVTFSWIFADSIKSIYNCFIFLLIIRPYNIGDRVVIEKEVLVVYKVDLLTTTFLTLDNRVVYIPNTKLIQTNIANLARSPPQNDILDLTVDGSTTFEKAQRVEEVANEMLAKEKHMFTGCKLEKLAGGTMRFSISHTKNFQNFSAFHDRQEASIAIFKAAMKKAGVSFSESYAFNCFPSG